MTDDTTTRTSADTDSPPDDALDEGRFAPGTVLAGRYRIVSLLGKGGMGEVYRADDLKLRQPVALKLLPRGLAGDPRRLARLLNEVRVARRISHPNVCRVHDIGEVGGQHFLSMEYVDGEDLASLLSRIGRLPPDKALEVSRQICAGLAAAHERGVLHRDMKPANVMIDGRGKVRLTDFGLAVVASEPLVPSEIAGTPAYMSPEQVEGGAISVTSDIYALGLVLYEIFTGRPTFKADSVQEALRLQREAPPPRPSNHVSDLDPQVERLILRCLEKKPERRPVSALAVSAALPGGDPLAAVLAAGETPPPEMVAAAGDVGALRPAVAWACLAFVVVACLASVHLWGTFQLFTQVLPETPPEVLAVRAREVIQNLGHELSPNGFTHAFEYDAHLLAHAGRTHTTVGRKRPGAIHFRYRQMADDWLGALRRPPLFHPAGFQRRMPLQPTSLVPGRVDLRLDTQGNLVEFHAERPLIADPEEPVASLDWATLFREMGLPAEDFAPVAPTLTPVVPADTRAAWEGSYPGTTGPTVRIEAAAHRGRVVSLKVLGPWNSGGWPAFNVTGLEVVEMMLAPVFPLVLVGGLLFAARNLRLRRGDRQGAFRLGSVVFATGVLASALGTRSLSTLADVRQSVTLGAAWALWNAALVWVLYVAIEPHVRRRWPETLVSWNRLLAGRFRDPRVGRDVLIGVMCPWLFAVPFLLRPAWGKGGVPIDLGYLSGAQYFFARQLAAVGSSIGQGLLFLLVLLLLRIVFRRQWVAVGAVVALATLVTAVGLLRFGQVNPMPTVLVLGLTVAGAHLLLMRVGLLALVVLSFVFSPVGLDLPMTLDFAAWYSQSTALYLLVVGALAAYGFYVSLGGRAMLGERFLEE